MPAKKAASRSRKAKTNQDNLAKLAAEQAASDNCTCVDHDDHDDCNTNCDCFNGETEPQVVGSIPYSVPLSTVMGQQEDERPKKKPPQSIREKYNLAKSKGWIAEDGLLMMSIWRLPIYSMDGTIGVQADREFCFRTRVTVEFLENEDFLPILQKYGHGAYSIVARHLKGVLTELDRHIGKPNPGTQAQAQVDPATGQTTIYYQQPAQNGATVQAEVIKPPTLKESLKDMVEQKRYLKELMDDGQEKQQAPLPAAPIFDSNAVQAEIMKTKAFAEGIASLINPGHGGKKSVTELLFEHGADILKGVGEHIVNPIIGAIQENKNAKANERPLRRIPPRNQAPPSARQPQAVTGATERDVEGDGEQESNGQSVQGNQTITPETELMNYLINAYLAKTPVSVVMGNLRRMESNDPDLVALFGGFATTDVEILTQWVAMLRPDLKEEISKPAATEWIRSLQQAIDKEWQTEEGEEEGE